MHRLLLIAVALLVGTTSAWHAPLPNQQGTKRTDLQRHDLRVPGREAIQVRVDLAPGVSFPRHTHPGEELVYVLGGSIEYLVQGKRPVTLNAGDVLFIPAGTVHSARNVGKGNATELATYVVEKGKPLLTLVSDRP